MIPNSIFHVGVGSASIAVRIDEHLVPAFKILAEPFLQNATAVQIFSGWTVVGFLTLEQHCQHGRTSGILSRITAEDEGGSIAVDQDAKLIFVAAESTKELLLAVLRTVRHVLRAACVENGWLFPHASVIVTRSGAIMICGRSGAGKTSLCLAALLCGAQAYLSNDDPSLYIANGRVYVQGWPRSVRIRAETVAALNKFHNKPLWPSSLWHPTNSYSSLLDGDGAVSFDVVTLLPRELVDSTKSAAVASCHLAAIIFPEWRPGFPAEFRLLDRSESTRNTFTSEVYPFALMPGRQFADHLEGLFPSPNIITASRHIQFIVANVPMFKLYHDHDLLEDTAWSLVNVL